MDRLLDAEVAERLRVSARTLRRLVTRTPGNAPRPWVLVGTQRRWTDDDDALDRWLRSLEKPDVVTLTPARRSPARRTAADTTTPTTAAELRRSWGA